MSEIVISGVGVVSPVGQGKDAFLAGLMEGRHGFDVMRRPGRQWPLAAAPNQSGSRFLGAEIAEVAMPEGVCPGMLRTASLSSRLAVAAVHEAWHDARLDGADPTRVGLLVGGSNFQQRELVNAHAACAGRVQFMRPAYGMSFMDSDLGGICSELFGIRGLVCTIGGASASGQLAVIQAIEAVRSGQLDVCIALGAMMDLSCYELQALRSMGAMGSDRFGGDPAAASRPFDRARDGFIFGESCAALVVERQDCAQRRAAPLYARAAGWGVRLEANRNPDPSLEGEAGVIATALAQAQWQAGQVDYVNAHGSGSVVGDDTEMESLRVAGISGAWLNTTKSIIGHGLTAAGAVELAATVLQMRDGRLHPCRNIDNPVESVCELVGGRPVAHRIERALKLSFGFGGMNTTLCLQRV